MRPGLGFFFDAMTDFLTHPAGPERLQAAYPDWEVSRSRVALYGAFVRTHVRTGLEKLYPLTQEAAGPAHWEQLVEGFTATRPARHFELNRMGESFPSFVADMAAAWALPEFLPALTRFEWTDWAVYSSEEPMPARVEGLTVNPTLTVLQHPFQLCAFVREEGRTAPAEGSEQVLLWRHPHQLTTWFMPAHEQALLVLKMTLEGLSPSGVAAVTGVAEETLHEAVETCAQQGLILRP
jgi:uncharacterized protein